MWNERSTAKTRSISSRNEVKQLHERVCCDWKPEIDRNIEIIFVIRKNLDPCTKLGSGKKLSADIIERSRRREHDRGFSLSLTFNFFRSVHAAADRLRIFHDQFEFSASRVRSDFKFGASSLVNREANRKKLFS